MIALSPALATLLLVAQVSTSTETCTPKACRDWREAYIFEHGTALKISEERWHLAGDLADANTRIGDLEGEQLAPHPWPEHSLPWTGWPWVALVIGVAVGAAGAVLLLEGPP